ncbi:MAG TPA: phosphopentomutase [Candidatus Limiplasma sp.]|nr:phosphopentomutase [Candidatus Limiplasma sp.]
MKRVFLIVLDSVGAGELPDAAQYGDVGASTLKHTLNAEHPSLPNLASMGFGYIPEVPCERPANAAGAVGRAAERSAGKDTTTGHWEMSGVILEKPFPTYPNGFPADVIEAFEKAIGRKTLGNYASSGTVILDELGEEHLKTGYPIVYTSADSVFQIAANEEIIPLETLYDWCRIARLMLVGNHAVGRVIARPFVGQHRGAFTRTPHRKDFSLEPVGRTLLDVLSDAGYFTMGVGKIEDIFCMRGIRESIHAAGNPACMEVWLDTMKRDFEGLVFVNLVDFDMVYGHRRDVKGYAAALEAFDAVLGEAMKLARPEDLILIDADHGCDPTFTGTDHTREYIPIVAWSPAMRTVTDLGTRATYADIAATIAERFGLPERFGAESFAAQLNQ